MPISKSEIVKLSMQRQEGKYNMREAVDAGLVVTESSGTKPDKQDTSSSLGNYITQASVKNADLKAQIQEKVFANAALNNELRKLKGNIVDSKFTKASILGKPPLQPSRNHLVVRQPNAFTSERPRISRPRFASQVDREKGVCQKQSTPHNLLKLENPAKLLAKPHLGIT
ncbi:hypothetical protein Tco_0455547 [Tanacetum coccineum]